MWEDRSDSELPGYALHYRIDADRTRDMTAYGDCATSQKALLDICKDLKTLDISLLPAEAKLDELD